MKKPEVWGETRLGRRKIQITITDKTDVQAETSFTAGVLRLEIGREGLALRGKKLVGLLIHEFTHVIEYLNDARELSTAIEDECTPLAQTMEAQMTELLLNLKVRKPYHWPLKLT